jgi:HK97 family phage prohead protease
MDNLTLVMKDLEIVKELGTSESSSEANIIYIKGFANRFLDDNGQVVVDRSGDSVLPSGYDLENFKKNPILLSYHDKQHPVGKIVDISVTLNGLEITAEVHQVLNEKVYYAVEKGILKTFSIGFRATDSMYDAVADIYYFKAVELLEVSIVSVPDNQDSIFTTLTQSPCASGNCLLASKATSSHTIACAQKIKNKEISDRRWNEVDKSILIDTISTDATKEVIEEAYLVVGDLEKKSSWKFPHHEFDEGKLSVNKGGVQSAFAALKSVQDELVYSKEVKISAAKHLLKHYEEMVETKVLDEVPEDIINFIADLETVEKETDDNTLDVKPTDEDGNEIIIQDAEGDSFQTAEGEVTLPNVLSFEQVLSYVESSEATDDYINNLLELRQAIDATVNSHLKY